MTRAVNDAILQKAEKPIRNWGTYTDEEFGAIRIFDDQKILKPEVRTAVEQIEDRSRVLFAFPV